MLRLILGRAGSGKTHEIYRRIAQAAADGEERMILLVPEQFSFASERAILHLLGSSGAGKIEILSFTRLADSVFREYGGLAGTRLDDAGRAVLMSLALEKVKDNLQLYRRQAEKTEMVAALLQTVDELKLSCVSPDALGNASASLGESSAGKKARELALIFAAYDALVAQSFLDERDVLTRLAEALQGRDFFKNRLVFVDSFKGFTAQELQILSCVISGAKETYVTLGTASLTETEDGMGLFSVLKKTGRRLVEEAKKHHVAVAPPVVLHKPQRFQNQALEALEAGLFDPCAAAFDGNADCVKIFSAQSIYEECEFTASQIKKLLRESSLRCREIAVIARNMDDYKPTLIAALEKYDIPFFNDNRRPVDTQPIMALMRCVFEILEWSGSDSFFHYLKTGLTDLTVEEISLLENYVFTWSITARQWKTDWSGHPDGFGAAFTRDAQEKLEEINALRKRVVSPIIRLEAAIADASGDEIAESIFYFLEEISASENLRLLARRFAENCEIELAGEQGRLWDLLMEILNQTAVTLRGRHVAPKRFGELLNLVISLQSVGNIPQGIDEAAIGSADRIRTSNPRVVFILGANEGVFPRTPESAGLLTDLDRLALADAGLEISGNLQDETVDERYIAYSSLCAACESLFVTYSRADFKGGALAPSVIVTQIKELLPSCKCLEASDISELDWLEGKKPAFEWMAAHMSEPSGLESGLKSYFGEREEYRSRIDAVERAGRGAVLKINNTEKARELFGENMALSASRIEQFYHCPFSYFCRYGLGVKAPMPAELDAMQTGTVVHYVLEHLIEKHGGKGLSEVAQQTLYDEISSFLTEYLNECMGGVQDKTSRFQYLFNRIAKTLWELVKVMSLEFAQSEFEPVDFELKIDRDGEVQPYVLSLPGGGVVAVRGKVDRVDVMQRNGVSYVRIIDYKSSNKSFRLSDVLAGLNMQMLIYLFTIIQNGGERYGTMLPAGILYMPAKRPEASLGRHASQSEIQKEKIKAVAMNGLVLDDPLVIRGMEHDAEGIFIPAKINAKGGTAGTVIRLAQMGRLEEKVSALIAQMGEMLHCGEVGAVPSLARGSLACDWCDFKSVCGHADDDAVNRIFDIKHADVLKTLEES